MEQEQHEDYAPGERVRIKGEDGGAPIAGRVAGYGFAVDRVEEPTGPRSFVLVELDRPRWTEGRETCVSLLVVHRSNLEREEG